MKRTIFREQDGQVLVQVALMIFVLLLFVGLAVDVGNVYGERRGMQNAADAGALAGAREICFGDPANAEGQAERYAIQENGAQYAEVEIIAGYKVRVVAMVAAETYFIRLIPGLETIDVSADATAACGEADSGCGFFPIAFDLPSWEKIGPCPLEEQFLVWNDDTVDDDFCEKCNCDLLDPEISANIGPGERGWVRLSAPSGLAKIPEECGNVSNCGTDALRCWLEHDYPGNINLQLKPCLPGDPGVITSGLDSVATRIGDTVRILLWEDKVCEESMKSGDCPGTWYYITKFGCVRVEEYIDKFTLPPLPGHTQNECPKNAKVIRVTMLCDCPATLCGSSAGTPIPDGGIGAVSLIE